MKGMFEAPQVEEVFGKPVFELKDNEEEKGSESLDSDEDGDPLKQDEKQKGDIISTFALNQIANIPTMFRGHLKPELLSNIIQFLVELNYFTETSEDIKKLAQFKLFGLV